MPIAKFLTRYGASGSLSVTDLQQHVKEVLDKVCVDPVVGGRIVAGVAFKADLDCYVYHGLGRPYLHVLPLVPDDYVAFRISPTKNHLPDRQCILRATGPCTGSFLFL